MLIPLSTFPRLKTSDNIWKHPDDIWGFLGYIWKPHDKHQITHGKNAVERRPRSIACVSAEKQGEIHRDFCDSLYVQTAVSVPAPEMRGKFLWFSGNPQGFLWFSLCTNRCQRSKPDWIRVISGSYPGTLWMNSEASGKSPRNVGSGTETVNRF